MVLINSSAKELGIIEKIARATSAIKPFLIKVGPVFFMELRITSQKISLKNDG
jgi:hypothetical protein